jgi:hypothetical protein
MVDSLRVDVGYPDIVPYEHMMYLPEYTNNALCIYTTSSKCHPDSSDMERSFRGYLTGLQSQFQQLRE